MPDEQLVASAKASDARAFAELSERYRGLIHKRVYNILLNREDAEDVLQNSLLKASCGLAGFKESCTFSTWITKIGINTARMLLRKRRIRGEISVVQRDGVDETERISDVPDRSHSVDRRYARQETLQFMKRALNGLSPHYKDVLEQFHFEEKSMRDAAEVLGISVASTKTRLFRGRRVLRSKLEGQRIAAVDASW